MAQFIWDNEEQVAFMTAKQLAEAVGQSDAAVIRFAQAVGYSGFPAMREAMRKDLLLRVGASGLARAESATTDQDLKRDVFESSVSLVKQTAELNSDAELSEVVSLIVNARRVFVSAHGTSYPLAAYLQMQLSHCLDQGELLTMGLGDLGDRFRSFDERDLVIGIGYVRYLPYTIDVLRQSRARGAQVVAITDQLSSPLAGLAHRSLFVARTSSSPAWWSQAGTMAVIDWLIALTVARDPKRSRQKLAESDEQLKQLGHWLGEDVNVTNGNSPVRPEPAALAKAKRREVGHPGRASSTKG